MSKIEWTNKTWNPLAGCTYVSPGCKNCYAATMAKRLVAMGREKYEGTVDGNGHWTGKINLGDEKLLSQPLRWKKPSMIFVNSMSDLFHEAVPFAFIEAVFEVMAKAEWHTFQVLTKRPARAADFYQWTVDNHLRLADLWPLQNVWLGTSVENQEQYDKRVPHLLKVNASVLFLSIEPLLGAIDFRSTTPEWGAWGAIGGQFHHNCGQFSWYEQDGVLCPHCYETGMTTHAQIGWVIAGGESGRNARVMHPDWVRSIRDQCVANDVPFFFKQWGDIKPASFDVIRMYADSGWSANKKKGGRLLDGRLWDEFPRGAE